MRWSSSMQPINFTVTALIPCGHGSNQLGDPVQILNWFLPRKWGCLLVWPEVRLGSLSKPVSTVYFILATLRTDLWSQGKCTTFLTKMSFICMRMKHRFHIKGWTLNLVLIQRTGGTGKRPIGCPVVLQETWASTETLGSLRSDDGDGNGNPTKTIGLISKTTILHVHHPFLYISLPSLHDYDVKMSNFTTYRGSTQPTTKFPLSFWTWIWFLGIRL